MPYIERKIYSGNYLEIERYFVTHTGRRMPKGPNVRETSFEQTMINGFNSFKRLLRLIHCNFSGRRGDMFVTLTHKNCPDEKTAKRERKNFLERVRYFVEKNNLPELKYMIRTEKQGQWHHHLIINALPGDLKTIKQLWGLGRITASPLDDENQFYDLVNYLEEEAKNADAPRQKNARRWDCSKNLLKPVIPPPREINKPRPTAQPRVPKGYRLLPDWVCGCDRRGNLYQSFRCIRLPAPPPHSPKKKAKND